MNKSCSLILAVTLTLAACEGSKQKTTWQKVTETKPDKIAAANTDAGESYTAKLHKVLAAEKVEHKVVTYQYHYQTRMRDEAVGTHQAVIYKDNSDPKNPWWLMDERLGKPVWLPGEDVNKQVAFYLRRNAQVVEQKEFTGGEPPAAETTMIAKHTAPVVPAGEPAVTRIAKAKPAPARETAVAQAAAPAPQPEPAPFIRPARFAPSVPVPYNTPAPSESHFDDIFRRAHGTDYDPESPLDRRKMETIKHALLDTREPAPTRTF